MKYAPLPPISAADAENEPADQQLFAPRITMSTTVAYRGRQLLITAEDLSADKFCDMLDKRFGATASAPPATNGQAPADAPPICPSHRKAMKPMKFADKQGHTFMCTAKVGDGWCEERA